MASQHVNADYARMVSLLGLLLAVGCSGIQVATMPSGSMEPTFRVGEKFSWVRIDESGRRALKVGDLVIHHVPNDKETMWLRRLAGRSGDKVEIRGRELRVNGVHLDRKWATHDCGGLPCDFGPITVPSGQAFVLGDHWENSRDSRDHGPIEEALIIGKVLYKE